MEGQKLSLTAFALAASLIWGGALFLVGLLNLLKPPYGTSFLQLLSSVYPIYDGAPTLSSVSVLTGSGLLDGMIGGLIFAWIYNVCISFKKK